MKYLKFIFTGLLLKKLIEDWQSIAEKKQQPPERKAILYGGHDSTITNILNALNVWDPQFPDYGIMIMFEFYKDLTTNHYGVQVRQNTNKILGKITDFFLLDLSAKFNCKTAVFIKNSRLCLVLSSTHIN